MFLLSWTGFEIRPRSKNRERIRGVEIWTKKKFVQVRNEIEIQSDIDSGAVLAGLHKQDEADFSRASWQEWRHLPA